MDAASAGDAKSPPITDKSPPIAEKTEKTDKVDKKDDKDDEPDEEALLRDAVPDAESAGDRRGRGGGSAPCQGRQGRQGCTKARAPVAKAVPTTTRRRQAGESG